MSRRWYEVLYENFEDYDQEPYTQNTAQEIAFILDAIAGDDVREVLDVGCGTGRHALGLAAQGYDVVGLDFSERMLEQGRRKAAKEGVSVRFVHGDARRLDYKAKFDLAIMLCEGGFSLVETDAMDRQILMGIQEALVPGGKLIFTAPSAVSMLNNEPEEGNFDLLTLRETFSLENPSQKPDQPPLQCSQRYYTFPELKCLLESFGFIDIEYFAVTENGYSRKEPLSTDHFEIGVIAVKDRN
jgi:SAM-dependent methyltransferase